MTTNQRCGGAVVRWCGGAVNGEQCEDARSASGERVGRVPQRLVRQ